MAPQPTQIVQVWRGRDEWIQTLGNLLALQGGAKYFKIGEGGWRASTALTEQLATGTGSRTVSGTIVRLPVVWSSVTVTAGSQVVTDDGSGGFTGDGTGTINYKTGDVLITYDANVTGGTPVYVEYQSRGGLSRLQTQVFDTGDGTQGPYTGILTALAIWPGSVAVSDGDSQSLVDDGAGNLGGDGTGTIDYSTGAISVTFAGTVTVSNDISAVWRYDGEPVPPDTSKSDLESEADSRLYTFQKDFGSGDIVFQGAGTATLRFTVEVETGEGNDDGSGEDPYFYEGGIFSQNDVLLAYFTFPKFKKTSSVAFTRTFDLKVAP